MSSYLNVSDRRISGRLRRLGSLVRQALVGGEKDYTRGSVGRSVLLLAVPMVLEMLMESVFAVTDIFFVAGLGADAIAAVGLTEAVVTVIYAVAIGLSMATTAVVARRVGERDVGGAAQAAGQALWIGAAVAVVTGAVGLLFSRDILELMGADQSVVRDGSGYTAILLGGSVTILFLFLINAAFRGAGDATLAMRALWIANGINIVLDPCLIYGWGPFPEMGVSGAATATTIGRGIGVVYQLYHLFGRGGRLAMRASDLALAPKVLLGLLRLSIGGVMQFFIAVSSWIVLIRIVSSYGSTAIAGYTIAIRIIDFTILPAWGLGNAAATLVGQNLGAGKPERAEQSVWQAARYNVAFLVAVAVVFIAFAEPILRIFTADAEVIDYGVDCLRFISYGYGFYALGMIMTQAFNGAGDTDTPTIINLFCFWMLQIPLAYWLAQQLGLGPRGVFVAIMIAESLMAIIGVIVFRRGKWKSRKV